jgi:DNA-binding transcriptional regulator GbsR (MarR family)
MAKNLSPLENDLIVEFGNIYEVYGFQRIKGLIVGLLLTQSEPLSLDDIVNMLNRSKGPISGAIRELATVGVVRKAEGEDNRKDYYTTHPDLFFNNFMFNMSTVRKNRRTAEQFLEDFSATEGEVNARLLGHLEQMRAFYTLMESFYKNFSIEWAAMKAQANQHNSGKKS